MQVVLARYKLNMLKGFHSTSNRYQYTLVGLHKSVVLLRKVSISSISLTTLLLSINMGVQVTQLDNKNLKPIVLFPIRRRSLQLVSRTQQKTPGSDGHLRRQLLVQAPPIKVGKHLSFSCAHAHAFDTIIYAHSFSTTNSQFFAYKTNLNHNIVWFNSCVNVTMLMK